MKSYIADEFEKENELILVTGVLSVDYGYRVLDLFKEKTGELVMLPKSNGLKKFKQSTDFGNVSCSFDRISGYVPFKNFVGLISEEDIEFSITQQEDFIYGFECIGKEEKVNDIFEKLKILL